MPIKYRVSLTPISEYESTLMYPLDGIVMLEYVLYFRVNIFAKLLFISLIAATALPLAVVVRLDNVPILLFNASYTLFRPPLSSAVRLDVDRVALAAMVEPLVFL